MPACWARSPDSHRSCAPPASHPPEISPQLLLHGHVSVDTRLWTRVCGRCEDSARRCPIRTEAPPHTDARRVALPPNYRANGRVPHLFSVQSQELGRSLSVKTRADLGALAATGALFVVAAWMRLGALQESPYPTGVDGYWYLIQVRSLVERGRLYFPSAPLVSWLMAAASLVLNPVPAVKMIAALVSSRVTGFDVQSCPMSRTVAWRIQLATNTGNRVAPA